MTECRAQEQATKLVNGVLSFAERVAGHLHDTGRIGDRKAFSNKGDFLNVFCFTRLGKTGTCVGGGDSCDLWNETIPTLMVEVSADEVHEPPEEEARGRRGGGCGGAVVRQVAFSTISRWLNHSRVLLLLAHALQTMLCGLCSAATLSTVLHLL